MSVRFDAETDHYKATTGLPASTTWTITCWVYLSVDQDAKSTIWAVADTATENAATANALLTAQANGTTLELESFTDGAGGTYDLTVGAWTKTAVVVVGATANFYFAAAGAALTLDTALAFTPPATNAALWIGRSTWPGEWFNGRVANFKMWQAALTQTEVETELASWTAVRTANLLRDLAWKQPETTDYSGNGNTLTGGAGATTESDPPIPRTPELRQPYTARRRAANW